MGESKKDALRVNFDRKLKLEFHGVKVTSDAGLLAYREIDDAFGLTEMATCKLTDNRTGKNTQHSLTACCGSRFTAVLQDMKIPTMPNDSLLTLLCVMLLENGQQIKQRLRSARWDDLKPKPIGYD